MSTTCCPDEPIVPIATLDFILPLGADYSIPLRFGPLEDPIVEENLTDFTGYYSEFVIHAKNELGQELLKLTTTNSGVTIDGVTVTVNFTTENPSPLPYQPMAFFWRFTSTAGVDQTLLKGTITPVRA